MSTSLLRVLRNGVLDPDAYDLHDAIVSVDGREVGRVSLGAEQEFPIDPGPHEVTIRLGMNFNKATVSVEAPPGGSVLVTCEKARPARNLVFHPSRYWRLSVSS